MVEYRAGLDLIFGSLADETRRDILKRLSKGDLTITQIAKPYTLTFAAISKHLKVLESAKLIRKKKCGREQVISLSPTALKSADEYLAYYRKEWEDRLDRLEAYLQNNP